MTEELIKRIYRHDAAALSEYMHLNRNRLIGFIEQQMGNALRRKVDSEDVFQEVNIEAVRALPQIQFGEREPMYWIFQVAERKIIDLHRFHFQSQKRAAHMEIELDRPVGDGENAGLVQQLVASMTSASQAYSRQVKMTRMDQAILHLPEEQQKALKMRYVDDLPSKEIAEKLGRSDASVRVMLTRALKRLQELLVEES